MRRTHAALATAVATCLAASAGAQELACEERIGLVELGDDGAPREDRAGNPVMRGGGAVLELRSYPALVGVAVEIRNGVGRSPAVVRAASAPVLDRILRVEGTLFETPLSLPPGASRSRVTVVAVESYEECLRWAGEDGGAVGPRCLRPESDLRVVVRHERGLAECRARLVCHPPGSRP